MAKIILAIVGAAQILGAFYVHFHAASNIHEIYGAILFGGGVLAWGVVAVLDAMERAAALVVNAIERGTAKVAPGTKQCRLCHADNHLQATSCRQCGKAFT